MSLTTILHAYRFDIDKGQADDYAAYVAKIREQVASECWTHQVFQPGLDDNHRKFSASITALDGQSVALETSFVTDNQWNTVKGVGSENGLRVFDWSEYIYPNRRIKQGYWLEQTADMREVRRNTMKCGYCGKMEPAQKGYVFCPHCLDSEYLKESDLYLTRMVSAGTSFGAARAPLTQAERDYLLPLYREAQLNGTTERGKARIAKTKARIESEYTKTVADATEKRDAARWIIRTVPGLVSNWIFYSHTGRHCFGWRTPLDSAVLESLLEVISEFPFAYEIKCADGRTLSN